jgi:hypothetical protein
VRRIIHFSHALSSTARPTQTQTLLDSMAVRDDKLAHTPTSTLRGKAARRAEFMKEVDDHYFNSYSHFRIHREMISDSVRCCDGSEHEESHASMFLLWVSRGSPLSPYKPGTI